MLCNYLVLFRPLTLYDPSFEALDKDHLLQIKAKTALRFPVQSTFQENSVSPKILSSKLKKMINTQRIKRM